jgi:hypothetical protein
VLSKYIKPIGVSVIIGVVATMVMLVKRCRQWWRRDHGRKSHHVEADRKIADTADAATAAKQMAAPKAVVSTARRRVKA